MFFLAPFILGRAACFPVNHWVSPMPISPNLKTSIAQLPQSCCFTAPGRRKLETGRYLHGTPFDNNRHGYPTDQYCFLLFAPCPIPTFPTSTNPPHSTKARLDVSQFPKKKTNKEEVANTTICSSPKKVATPNLTNSGLRCWRDPSAKSVSPFVGWKLQPGSTKESFRPSKDPLPNSHTDSFTP